MKQPKRLLGLAAVLVSLLQNSGATGQPEEVVVTATAPEKIETHVTSLTVLNRDGQIARWHPNIPLCLKIVGLNDQTAAFMTERFRERATALRLSVVTDGCRPRVTVLFTEDPDSLMQRLVGGLKARIRRDGGISPEALLRSKAAVRWITLLNPMGFANISNNSTLPNSRITQPTAPSITDIYLVADLSQIKKYPFATVIDYLNFVALANPAMNTAPDLPSVMDLFGPDEDGYKRTGLTFYDEVYLDALYAIRMDRDGKQQRRSIREHMVTGLSRSQE